MCQRLLTVLLLSLVLSSCSRPLSTTASSLKDAADYHLTALLDGDPAAFHATLMTFEEYAALIHPHLPEAQRMSAETKWRAFTGVRRPTNVSFKVALYNNKGWRLLNIGIPRESFDYDEVKVHRRVPVTLVREVDGQMETRRDDSLLGVVVERGGRFMILNVLDESKVD